MYKPCRTELLAKRAYDGPVKEGVVVKRLLITATCRLVKKVTLHQWKRQTNSFVDYNVTKRGQHVIHVALKWTSIQELIT